LRRPSLPVYVSYCLRVFLCLHIRLFICLLICLSFYLYIYIYIYIIYLSVHLPTYLSIHQSNYFFQPPITSLSVKSQISHYYKRACTITFLHVQIFKILVSGLGKRNAVHGTVADVYLIQSALNVFMIAVLIYEVYSQIFALFRKFQGYYLSLCFELILKFQ